MECIVVFIMSLLGNLLYATCKYTQQRNSLNHFGFDKASANGGIQYSSFEKKLEDFMNELAQL